MSTGSRTHASFIQGNQSTVDQDDSRSALFYLFQEVSRLASPLHNSFLGTDSPTEWLNESPGRDNFIVAKEDNDTHFLQTLNSSCQHGLSDVPPYNQVNKAKEENPSSEVTTLVESHCVCNSPWKVLTLINLQCERLLHQKDVEESDPSSISSTTNPGHPTAKPSTAAADVTEQGMRGDCVNVKYTLRPSPIVHKRQVITASAGEDARGDCSGGASVSKPQCCVKDSRVGCLDAPQTAERTDAATLEPVDDARASSQPQHLGKREVEFSVNRELEWNQECEKDCFSTEQDILDVPFNENTLSRVRIPNASLDNQLTFNLNKDTSMGLSKSALPLDYNANVTLTMETPPQSATLPSSQSAALLFNAAEACRSLPKTDNKNTGSELEYMHASTEDKSHPVGRLKSSATVNPQLRPVQEEDIAHPPSSQPWRTKNPRKQPHPSRSADIQDPDFQGVTFRMGTELDDSREECRLLITSKYSKELRKSVRKPRLRTRASQKSLKTSSSDEESEPTAAVSKGKVCASCCTRKTPMWRDAEDGTPLCNACGIRYKKYRVRCVNCWHIPRKESNSNSCCFKCGNSVRLTSAQRKHTT